MSEDNLSATAISEVTVLARESAIPVTTEPIHYVVVPEGCDVQSLINYQYPEGMPPTRRKAKATFFDAMSFCTYVELYQDDRTRIFANPNTSTFLGVLDYHGAGDASVRRAEFCDHTASYPMILSDQWKIWTGRNHPYQFSQVDFAEFLEDNTKDLLTPNAATFLEIAQDLKANTEVNFESKVKRTNGNVQMRYQETTTTQVGAAGTMEVPEIFSIRIPVYYGEEAIVISARLRFRISSGKLTFSYKLDRPTEMLKEAFEKAVTAIAETLKTAVLLGTP